MASIGDAADLDYVLTMDAGLAAILSARGGLPPGAGIDDEEAPEPGPIALARRLCEEDGGIQDLLDWLDLGVIIANAAGRLIRLNRRAESILAREDGMSILPSGLAASYPEETRTLRDAIAAATTAGTRLRLSRPSGKPPLLVSIIPVRNGDDAGSRSWVALFVMDPARAAGPAPALLQEMFGLTEAEAAFAAEIGRGSEPQAAAERLAIAAPAAQIHLSRIFEKTGTRRPAELAGLLAQCDRFVPSSGCPISRIAACRPVARLAA